MTRPDRRKYGKSEKKRFRRTEQAHEDNRHRSRDSRRTADNLRALYESPVRYPHMGRAALGQ